MLCNTTQQLNRMKRIYIFCHGEIANSYSCVKKGKVQYETLYAEGTSRRNKGLVHVSVYFLPRIYPSHKHYYT